MSTCRTSPGAASQTYIGPVIAYDWVSTKRLQHKKLLAALMGLHPSQQGSLKLASEVDGIAA